MKTFEEAYEELFPKTKDLAGSRAAALEFLKSAPVTVDDIMGVESISLAIAICADICIHMIASGENPEAAIQSLAAQHLLMGVAIGVRMERNPIPETILP